MRTPPIKFGLFFFLSFVLIEVSIAQENNPTKYPYGGVRDSSRMEPWMEFVPLNFDGIAEFSDAKFDGNAEFSNAKFDSTAFFYDATFDGNADFSSAKFDNEAGFEGARFKSRVKFDGVDFYKYAVFRDATFRTLAKFESVHFHSKAIFKDASFNGLTEFAQASFGYTDFESALFKDAVNFRKAEFRSNVDFDQAIFESAVTFWNDKFNHYAGFLITTFKQKPFFQKAVFKGWVNLIWANFNEGVDFRQSNFDSVTAITLSDIHFPEGKLYIYWEQFKGKDNLRIKLFNPSYSAEESIKGEHYTGIKIIYHKLRDNFLAQGNESSADEVMYELGWQRKEILKEFHWQLYDIFFGYGYQPWRFLLFVLLPIILIFAIIWYWFYYPTLVFIKSDLFPEGIQIGSKEKYLIKFRNFKLLKMRISDFTKVPVTMNPLTRYWHVLYFSTSVLLGIRFQKDWIKVFPKDMLGRKSYIRLVTFEWALGIILFVVFALLVKGIRFSFVKDLLGF